MSRRRLLLLGASLAAGCTHWDWAGAGTSGLVAGTDGPLHSPFPVPVAQPGKPRAKPKAWDCEDVPTPTRSVKGISKYDQKDKSRSRIDPEREKAHKAATQPVNEFAKEVASMADEVASGRAQPGQADCAWSWLETWANADALVGDDVDEAIRKWTLAGLSSAVLKLGVYGPAPSADVASIHAWLRRMGANVRDDYSRDLKRSTRRNNHLCWAAWAATITGVTVGDRSLFDWGLDRYRVALAEVQADGSLPLETARGARALGYHGFAVGPLVMIAEAGEANGVPMYQDGRLNRLAGFVLKAFADPAILSAQAGVQQDLAEAIKPTNLAWIEPYYRRTRDPRAEPWLRAERPLGHTGLGGNLTMLFGVALA